MAVELGRALLMAGRVPEAIALYERAIDELDVPDGDLSLRLESELIGAARLDMSRRAEAAERLARVGRHLSGDRPSERPVLANVAFEMLVRGEPPERTVPLARRALADGALLADESPDSPVYHLACWTLAMADRLEEADDALELALQEARVRGSALGFTIASCFRSNVAFRMGSVLEAEAQARAVLDVEPEHRWALGLPFAVAFLIDALLERDALEPATEALEQTGFADGDVPDFSLFIWLLFGRGRLRIARGEVQAGVDDLLLCGERSLAWGSRNPTFLSWRSNAALALDHHQRARAEALIAEELALARAAGAERATGIALRARGVLTRSEDDLRLAASTLHGCGAQLEHARALTDLGALQRRSRRRAEAREPLRRALELASRCHATVLAQRAEEELRATGARPRTVMLSGPESLTASERRVARMAASGLSNRAIAQALFVTLKTVEAHLSHIYLKLDIASRGQLASALGAAQGQSGESNQRDGSRGP